MSNPEINSRNNTNLKPYDHEIFPRKCKVSSKILIKQHLNAHYRNIQSVKAYVDNTTPYSFSHNPTTKGYLKSYKGADRIPLSTRPESNSLCNLTTINTFSDDPEVDRIVRRFILDSNDKLMEPLGLGEHRSEVVGNKNTCEKCDCSDGEPIILRKLDVDCFSTKTAHRRQLLSTDVLDIHRDKFTSPKPFSPRTMKSNVSSKLISLRCYNPPKRISRRQSDSKVSLDVKPVMHFKKQVGTCTTNSDMEAIDNTKHEESNTDKGETTFSHLNKRISNYSSKHILPSSHHRRISQRNRQNQSMSTEYIDGLHNFGKVKQWLNTLPGNSTVHKPEIATSAQCDEEKLEKSFTEKNVYTDNTDKQMLNKPTGNEVSIENLKNEVNYLKFISSVTDDVLTRGVLTDKNVNTILHEHATMNEYGLSKDQIKNAIQHIRTQLNVRNEVTTTTPITTNISHLLYSSSSGLLFHDNETMINNAENEKSHVQQQRQHQNQPTVSYKTVLDIKPLYRSTSSLLSVPCNQSHQPNNRLSITTTPTTTTSITIRPNQSINIPKDAQEVFQHLMNTNGTDAVDGINNNILFQHDYELQKDKCSVNQHQNVYVEKLVDKRNLSLNGYDTNDEYIEVSHKHHCENKINEDIKNYENTLNNQFNALLVSNTTTNTTITNNNSVNNLTLSNPLKLIQHTKSNEAFNNMQIQYNPVDAKTHLIIEHNDNDDENNDETIEEKRNSRQNRVKFASEAEFFSPSYCSEQATSISSFTDLSHLSNFSTITTTAITTTTTTTTVNINPSITDTTEFDLYTSPETMTTILNKSSLQISNLNNDFDNINNSKEFLDLETKGDKNKEQETLYNR
ncbi:hypothetical protein MS3_00006246 [Schistosoma haematobium]|uniref:Uncharacterized protein n=2 Tax=Schistosoma haematobium TaxID=6185 RepID=A0A922LHC3_SCHHA|nr:hypothetical protein MS3_00006246 [Schistosoma haematobium]KAH9584765.1 hypothetical protein MS3_00006246 [Schistosoma haematobium]CAH8506118.1 unnamed protein product [Schistosoma haematobium]CAH8508528.1 unnamed protein product [Schistosoma haematobium]